MNCILRVLVQRNSHHYRHRPLFHNSAIWQKIVQFNLSDIGEGIAEVQLKEWHVKIGDRVNEFDEICAVQSDKASVTITSRYSGTIKKLYFQPDDIAKVGQALVDIEIPEISRENVEIKIEADDRSSNMASSPNLATQTNKQSGKILASPAVRRLIREYTLPPETINGTGPGGRILKSDILAMVQQQSGGHSGAVSRTSSVSSSYSSSLSSSSSSSDDDESEIGQKIVPIRGYTRAMIKTMTAALEIPHFGYGDEIVVDELIKARELLTAHSAKNDCVKLSYMPFIIKAASLALKEYPILNSSLDEKKENIVYKHSHNICFAMDTPDGLAVPTIKNCQKMNVWEIATKMNELMKRGMERRFDKGDLTDGTFTLSNIGSIGGTFMSPVILPPQVAIGAIGKIRKVPIMEGEEDEYEEPTMGTQSVMNVFWAADHRVIDGATLARFSNRFKQFLEHPALMLAQLR